MRNAYPISRAPSGAVTVGGFTVIPTRNAWRITAPDGSALAVRDSYKRAVLRAWRAAADGPHWRAFL